MNFGIFIEDVGESRIAEPAYRLANAAINSPNVTDVSLFYQSIGRCLEPRNFGIFNATDVCYFKGILLVTFLDGLRVLSNEINNRTIYFYYGLDQRKDLFGYLHCLEDTSVTILAAKDDIDFVKRKLMRNDVVECNRLEDALEVINV